MRFRLRRGGGAGTFLRSRWVRWPALLLGALLVAWIAAWFMFARNLPSADKLLSYEPPLPTNVRAYDGTPLYSYARERRVELSYAEFPPVLIHAFISAEDKTFFEHGGVDFPGLAGAVFDYVSKLGSGRRAKGGSTITQQVAKNLAGRRRIFGEAARSARRSSPIGSRIRSPSRRSWRFTSTRFSSAATRTACSPPRAPISTRMWAI